MYAQLLQALGTDSLTDFMTSSSESLIVLDVELLLLMTLFSAVLSFRLVH